MSLNKIKIKMLRTFAKLGYPQQSSLIKNLFNNFSSWPSFQKQKLEAPKTIVKVIHSSEASSVLSGKKVEQFSKDNKVAIDREDVKEVYLS